MEVVADKSRNTLSERVMGSDNGEVRIAGFMDFGEEVESGGAGIGIWKREMPCKESSWRGPVFEGE